MYAAVSAEFNCQVRSSNCTVSLPTIIAIYKPPESSESDIAPRSAEISDERREVHYLALGMQWAYCYAAPAGK